MPKPDVRCQVAACLLPTPHLLHPHTDEQPHSGLRPPPPVGEAKQASGSWLVACGNTAMRQRARRTRFELPTTYYAPRTMHNSLTHIPHPTSYLLQPIHHLPRTTHHALCTIHLPTSHIPPPTSYNLFTTYHVLRTTYYAPRTTYSSLIPPPTPHLLHPTPHPTPEQSGEQRLGRLRLCSMLDSWKSAFWKS